MRAVVFDRHGPPEVLRIADLPMPVPGPRQVRVRVRAAGIQPFDTMVRQGTMSVPVEFPQQLGNEFAGVIDDLGAHVHGWAAGDPVLGWAPMASLAEHVLADTDAIVSKPSDLPWDEAGGLGASGQTALTAVDDLGIGPGDTVLIHAAAGGAGSMAVQIARFRGAEVIGTAGAHNHEYLRQLGATPLTYGADLVERVRRVAPRGIDAALDAVGGQALRDSVSLVSDPSRIGTLVDHDRAEELGVLGIRARRSVHNLSVLTDMYDQGALHVHVRSRHTLDQIREAHRQVEQAHGAGKVITTIQTAVSDARPRRQVSP